MVMAWLVVSEGTHMDNAHNIVSLTETKQGNF